jgi:two-component system CitB family sensor kinase
VRRRLSLAGQLLALQLVIVSIVLVAVAAVSLAQSDATFRATEGRRALSAAERVASEDTVRYALENPRDIGAAQERADDAQSVSASSYVTIARADRIVIASPDPNQVRSKLDLHGSPVLAAGRAWVGVVHDNGRKAVVAHVPVLSAGKWHARVGEVLGVVVVAGSTQACCRAWRPPRQTC